MVSPYRRQFPGFSRVSMIFAGIHLTPFSPHHMNLPLGHQSSKKSKKIQQSTCAALDRLGYLQLSPQSYKRDSTEDVGSKSPKCPCVRLAPNIACQRLKGQHWHGKWGRRANVLIKLCQNPAHLQDFCNATTSNAEFYKPHAQHSS